MAHAHSLHVGYTTGKRFPGLDLALVVGLHAVVVATLLASDVVPMPAPLATLTVQMLPPQAAIAPPNPDIQPPRPKPISKTPPARRDPVRERPVVAAQTAAPAPAEAPAA